MLDIKLIREQPELVRERLASRGAGDESAISLVLEHDEKRRKAMELIFFPGILNNDGAISSLSKFLFNGIMTLDNEKEPLLETAQALVTEIRAQMELLAAENSDLTMKPASV